MRETHLQLIFPRSTLFPFMVNNRICKFKFVSAANVRSYFPCCRSGNLLGRLGTAGLQTGHYYSSNVGASACTVCNWKFGGAKCVYGNLLFQYFTSMFLLVKTHILLLYYAWRFLLLVCELLWIDNFRSFCWSSFK